MKKNFNQLVNLFSLLPFLLIGCGIEDPKQNTKEASPKKNEKITYVTWPLWEADRVASIWLIKRYLSPNAKFIFINKGEPIQGYIPFDMPEAKYQRKHNQACFQIILKDHNINDPVLFQLSKLIWDIEINFWSEKKFEESNFLKAKLDKIFEKKLTHHETIEACCAIFDEYIKTTK